MKEHTRLGPWVERVERQPGWAVRAALFVTFLALVIPIAILIASALFIGFIVFIVLALIAMVFGGAATLWRRITGRDRAGRQNVRVIRRDEPGF